MNFRFGLRHHLNKKLWDRIWDGNQKSQKSIDEIIDKNNLDKKEIASKLKDSIWSDTRNRVYDKLMSYDL
jgi:hypothetical protein